MRMLERVGCGGCLCVRVGLFLENVHYITNYSKFVSNAYALAFNSEPQADFVILTL